MSAIPKDTGTAANDPGDQDPQETNPQQVTGDEFTATRNRLLSYDAYQKAFFEEERQHPQ